MIRRAFPILVAALVCTSVEANDVRGYDKLGPINVGLGGHRAFKPIERFKASDWAQRRRGYVVFHGRSMEGEGSTMQLFIEPTSAGDWHIRGISRGRRRNSPGSGDREFEEHYEATAIKWRTDRGITVPNLTDDGGKTVMTLN